MNRRRIKVLPNVPKYRQVFEKLSHEILSGKYAPGQKFPSEAALVQQFGTSRITVGRAMRELSQRGLVERVAGSGTYVGRGHVSADSLLFGLLIPDLGTSEIFEPICQGLSAAPTASRHGLLWGHVAAGEQAPEEQALGLCDQFIASNVAGVFFAPLERGAAARETNSIVVSRLEEARIPMVLLDRPVAPYPHRSRHDLVGIDNRRAAYLAAEYLAQQGAGQISFLAYSGGASTIDARIAGFRECWQRGEVYRVDEITAASVGPLLQDFRPGDGFVCANRGRVHEGRAGAGISCAGAFAHRGDRRCGVCQPVACAPDHRQAAMPGDRRGGHGNHAQPDREPESRGPRRPGGMPLSGAGIGLRGYFGDRLHNLEIRTGEQRGVSRLCSLSPK
jgi:DNA-binding LacI/PurR family transcriptional regulator